MKRKNTGYAIGGLALLALAVAGGVYFFPEIRRYMLIRRM
jgi:uncharacterized protein DUF6893